MNGSKRFVLIRHGQSEDNAGLRSRGLGKTHLTDLGREQARKTAAYLTEPPDLIVISPFIRTLQTAEPTIEKFTRARVDTWPIEEFRQLGKAHYESKDHDHRMSRYDKHWQANDPDYVDGPGAESLREFAGRLVELNRRLVESDYGLAYVFCHGFLLRSFLLSHAWGSTRMIIENIPHFRDSIRSWDFPNCGVVQGLVTADGGMLLGQIDTSHLPQELHS